MKISLVSYFPESKKARVMSIILLAAVLLALAAFAVYTFFIKMPGSGTAEDPYRVDSAERLNEVRDHPRAYFVQTKDIDLSGYPNWIPIGGDSGIFLGTYDGNGHKITGLSFHTDEWSSYSGLFGLIGTSGVVKNLGVSGKASSGDYTMVGLLAGGVFGATVENCWSEGEVQSGAHSIGGLIGMLSSGGIARSCYSTATVIGGIEKSGSIGGLCGSVMDGATLENSFATGPVSGGELGGGLVGYTSGYEGMVAVVRRCYATGAVSGRVGVGGLIGRRYSEATIVKDCFWDSEASGQTVSQGGEAKSTAQLKDLATFAAAGWDFLGERENGTDDVWKMDAEENGGYPSLSR